MASIKRRSDGRWRARYRDPGGRERAKHFARRIDAERWLDGKRAQLVRGDYVDPAAGKVTFGEYAATWQAGQVCRPSSAAKIDRTLRRHVLPRWESRPIGSIRPSEVQSWVREVADHLAPNTVASVVRTASAVFRAAIADRLIAVSPCAGVKLPEIVSDRVTPLELSQVHALADEMPDRYRALVVLGAGTGVRISEALGLTVDRVDFLRRMLTIDRQLVAVGELGPPKTRASVRDIPLPDVVLDALSQHLAAFPSDGFVFTNEAGRPIARNRFAEVWSRARGAAALPTAVTYHDLRHHYASLLIRHGESVKVVQARLGHASAAETLDTYSHLWPDSEDRTRNAVDSVWKLATTSRGLTAD
jgi:integrase